MASKGISLPKNSEWVDDEEKCTSRCLNGFFRCSLAQAFAKATTSSIQFTMTLALIIALVRPVIHKHASLMEENASRVQLKDFKQSTPC